MFAEIYLLLASKLTPCRQNQFILVITKLVLKVILHQGSVKHSHLFLASDIEDIGLKENFIIFIFTHFTFFFQPMVIWFVQNILLSEGYANNLEKKSKQRRGKKKKKEGHRKVNFAGETIANNSADV